MPTFDLRHIRAAKFNGTSAPTYTDAVKVGDAMSVNLNLRFAEGRLYTESTLAEYLRSATGGTASIAVKYLTDASQKLMFGMRENTRQANGKSVKSLQYGANDLGNYIGFAFYAPDMVDNVEKYTCVLVMCARFGPPAMQYQTKGENYFFNTPTTTGEFLGDRSDDKNFFELAVVDDEETAAAWVDSVVNYTEPTTPETPASNTSSEDPE